MTRPKEALLKATWQEQEGMHFLRGSDGTILAKVFSTKPGRGVPRDSWERDKPWVYNVLVTGQTRFGRSESPDMAKRAAEQYLRELWAVLCRAFD